MTMQTLGWNLEIKNLDEAGHIAGIAAGFNNVDFGGDRILPGAFAKSLTGRARIPMLFGHDDRRPIGSWSKFAETEKGLEVEGKISVKARDGGEAYELVKDGALAGLSIGYRAIKEKMVGKVRDLMEIYLHEVSLVSVGMNPVAVVTGVKQIEDLRARLAAGDRLTEREWELLLKKGFNLSNSEAERAVRINLKNGQGAPDDTADPMAALWAAMRDAEVVDLTGED